MLPMNDVVNVIVNLSPRATVRKAFNLALIIGTSGVLKDQRVKEYNGMEEMQKDGFKDEMPEYEQAKIFFQASTKPRRLLVGVQKEGEELQDAVVECRNANREWYALISPTNVENDVLALASLVESMNPSTILAFTSETEDILSKIKGLGQTRTFGVVSKNAYAHVAPIAWAMGAQTGLVNSAYTLFGKTMVGITPDDWESDDIKRFKEANANYYVNRGDTYNMFEEGVMSDGAFFDEIINLDKLANDIQIACMDKFTTLLKIAQTEDGIEILRNAIIDPLEESKKIGFIAPGVYTGDDFMGLRKGDMLTTGYVIFNESLASQSPVERDKRMLPNHYVILKEAGAGHSVTIQLNVNR